VPDRASYGEDTSGPESERVLDLLNELSILRELENHAAHQERYKEILAEIKALAEQKKRAQEQPQRP
jgi:hypothetical protein